MPHKLLSLLGAATLGLLAGCTTSLLSSAAPSPGSVTRLGPGGSSAPFSPDTATSPAFAASVPPEAPGSPATSPGAPAGPAFRELERGQASWYAARFHGRRTASGESHDPHALTAAHKTLPFGTLVRVRSLVTGKEVEVRVNDRGPFVRGRVIDVSRAAAEALGLMALGVKQVSLHVADPDLDPAGPDSPLSALR